jgi:hypothetical protein
VFVKIIVGVNLHKKCGFWAVWGKEDDAFVYGIFVLYLLGP